MQNDSLDIVLIGEIRAHVPDFQQVLGKAGHRLSLLNPLSRNLAEQILDLQPDVIIFDIDIPDASMFRQIGIVNHELPRPVIMFTCNDDRVTIDKAIKAGIAAHVVKGYDPDRILSVITIAIARFRKTHAMQEELVTVKNQLEERKIIEKAKGIIMQQAGMDEKTAYSSLRSMAMNKNQKLVEIARSVITTAELMT